MDVHGRFAHDGQNYGTTQTSFQGCMVKHTLVQAPHGILFAVKQERTIDSCLDDSPENYEHGNNAIPTR